MNELKAFDVGLGRYTEDGYPCVVAFDADQNPRLLGDEKVYLKSEADKVIAEKDAEIARLKAIRKVHVEAIESMGAGLLQDEEEKRHFKYKRCLAMAMCCAAERDIFNLTPKVTKVEFFARWHKRWLEIATKFKEAK